MFLLAIALNNTTKHNSWSIFLNVTGAHEELCVHLQDLECRLCGCISLSCLIDNVQPSLCALNSEHVSCGKSFLHAVV